MTLTPSIVISASASLAINVTMYDLNKFSYSTENGFQNESEDTRTNSSLDFSGKIYIGLPLETGCNVICEQLAKASLTFSGGVEMTGNILSTSLDDECEHSCKKCIGGELSGKFGITGTIEIFDTFTIDCTIAEFTWKISDWYYSCDRNEFDWTQCPYKKYKVTVQLVDNTSPIPYEKIYINCEYVGATNKIGIYTTYLPFGEYSLITNIYQKDFIISDKSVKIILNASDSNSNNSDMSGNDGKGCYWQFSESSGSLVIYGTGEASFHLRVDKVKSVTILDGITGIASDAFSGCSNLEKITIPNSVTSIGHSAFNRCKSLKEITIPDSVTSIGGMAFNGCHALEEITIPDNVTNIDSYTFWNCINLKKVEISNNVKSIGQAAFYSCESLKEIIIPDSVTNIENTAFAYCSDLTEVKMADSVVTMGYSIFLDCKNLKNVKLSNNIKEIPNSTFYHCRSLENINIPEKLETIGNSSFYGCGFDEITISEHVKKIASNAFNYCTNLIEATIIGNINISGVFRRCSNLLKINVTENNEYHTTIDGVLFSKDKFILIDYPGGKVGHYNIPDGTQKIESRAFLGCTNLSGVTFPNTLISIGDCAFASCLGLTEIVIPESVTYIGEGAFSGCKNLSDENVVIMNDEAVIGTGAFNYGGISVPLTAQLTVQNETDTINQTIKTTESNPAALTSIIETNANALNATVSDLIQNTSYFVVIVKSDSVEDVLSADNLLYFAQVTSDAEGKIALSYVPRESCDAPVVLTYRAYVNSIEDADIKLKDMYYTGSEQTAEYVVTFNGKTLTEGKDFTVSGDLSVTETGYYSITFTGINDYQGSVTEYYISIDSYLYGDIDMDGRITVKDSTTLQRFLAELENLTEDSYALSDVDCNGEVNINDVTVIQNYLVGVSVQSACVGANSAILK